jgi:hypothetical protein
MTDKPARIDVKYLDKRLVRVQVFGKLDGEEAGMLMDAVESHVADEPYFMLQTVISHVDGATPSARRTAADRLRQMPPRFIAIVGGSFAQRTTAKLVLTATTLLGSRAKTKGAFFEDEEEARAWLREQAAAYEVRGSADS